MLRIVLLLVLAFVLLRFLTRLAIIVLAALPAARAIGRTSPRERERVPIPLVRCSRCGTYVPQATARGPGDAPLCGTCATG